MISAGKETVTDAACNEELKRLSAEWSTLLGRAAAELRTVAGSTEDEFLAIGGRLQDFYQRGGAISGLASDMVGEVAGEHVTSAMDGLSEMLDDMAHYVSRAQNEIEHSSRTLRQILELLDQVTEPLSGFRKVNKVLRMLGISTKIESARLGQSAAGFETLASDVGELSVQVNEKAAVILKRKEDLARSIEQTLVGVLDSGAQQHDRVMASLERTRASLEALTAINGRCSSAVAGVSAVSHEVSRNIGEVVISMQAHDIVRQQIEHVDQALSELKQRLQTGLAGADEAACICELQSAQLRHADQALAAAVQTIVQSLREVARKQSGLSAQTSGMAGMADQAGGSFFAGMEKEVSVVSGALLESDKVNQSLCLAMGTVAQTVGEIACFVGDIERIGEEIKLIALNAQIQSAYTGIDGASLGVLAEAIQRLSIDAIAHTGAVSDTLQAISAATRGLNEGVCAETSGLESQVHGMVRTLSGLLDGLRRVNESLRGSLTRMDDQVTLLSSEIEQVVAGITVQRTVSRVLQGAIELLAGIIGEARRQAPASARSLNLDELASRYTMQSERTVHQTLLETGCAPAPAAGSDEGLGCNVELF